MVKNILKYSFNTDSSLHLQTVAAGNSYTSKSKIKLNKTECRPTKTKKTKNLKWHLLETS